MEKEYLKVGIEEIRDQIAKAKDEAIRKANHEIKAIVAKYEGRENKKQLLADELTKAKCYDDSFAGAGYINSKCPVYDDDEILVDDIANFYANSEVYGAANPRIGLTKEDVLKMCYEDSLRFLKRYYLDKYLSGLQAKLEDCDSSGLLVLFKGNKSLTNEYISYCKENKNNSRSQVRKYKIYGKDKVFLDRGYIKDLHGQLVKMGLTNRSYDSFKKYS